MSDLLYIGITAAFFILSGLYVRFCQKTLTPHPMETILVGGIALCLFIYLFVAMTRPEKF